LRSNSKQRSPRLEEEIDRNALVDEQFERDDAQNVPPRMNLDEVEHINLRDKPAEKLDE